MSRRVAGGRQQQDDRTTEVFRALVEPRRRAILRLVGDSELAAGQIADAFDITRPAISQHLTVLKDAGLLIERREGTKRLYRVSPERIAELRAVLDELWGDALGKARRLVEGELESDLEEAM